MRKQASKQAKVPDALIEALETLLARLWEGERYASVSEAATLIGRIERTPRTKSEQQQQ